MNTNEGQSALILGITREEIIEDNLTDALLDRREIPSVSFNVDLVRAVTPEFMFLRVEEEFRKLGFVTECVDTVYTHSYARTHIRVSSVNRRTKEIRMSKLVVVVVEGKFVSVTTFPLS